MQGYCNPMTVSCFAVSIQSFAATIDSWDFRRSLGYLIYFYLSFFALSVSHYIYFDPCCHPYHYMVPPIYSLFPTLLPPWIFLPISTPYFHVVEHQINPLASRSNLGVNSIASYITRFRPRLRFLSPRTRSFVHSRPCCPQNWLQTSRSSLSSLTIDSSVLIHPRIDSTIIQLPRLRIR
jgi:hypothetical protein